MLWTITGDICLNVIWWTGDCHNIIWWIITGDCHNVIWWIMTGVCHNVIWWTITGNVFHKCTLHIRSFSNKCTNLMHLYFYINLWYSFTDTWLKKGIYDASIVQRSLILLNIFQYMFFFNKFRLFLNSLMSVGVFNKVIYMKPELDVPINTEWQGWFLTIHDVAFEHSAPSVGHLMSP